MSVRSPAPLFLLLFAVVACSETTPTGTTPVATTVQISSGDFTLAAPGETAQLSATVRDQDASPMPGATVIWASGDDAIATVSSSGLVTAVAAGSTAITASSGSANGQVTATVSDLPILAADEVCADFPSGGIVTFTDAELTAAVEEALGLAAGSAITCSALATLERLETGRRGVATLAGLQNAVSLTLLSVEEEPLSDLTPLASLTQLDTLDLRKTQVSDLSALAGLSALRELDLDEIALVSDLTPLSGLTGLEALSADNNQISNLTPLSGLTALTYLNVHHNQVSELSPIAALTSLERLRLHDNQITDLTPLALLTMLDDLELQNNSITNLSPLASLTSLRRLILDGNGITNLGPLSGLTTLEELDVRDNAVVDLTPLSGLTAMYRFRAWQNSIVDPSPLAGLTALTFLDLDWNSITDVSSLASLTALEHLDIGDNNLTDISALSTLIDLTSLDVEDSELPDIDVVASFTKLERLKAQRNPFSDLSPLQNLTQLTEIDLEGDAAVMDIGALLSNSGVGIGDFVRLTGTGVTCSDIDTLRDKGVLVEAESCPFTPTVLIGDNFFDPTTRAVPIGSSVTWNWTGSNSHNVTFSSGPTSPTQSAGTFVETFTTAGTFDYVCTIHAGMAGTIVVIDDD